MSDIKIICDSMSDIPKHLREEYDIDVVPLTVIIEGKEYKDGVDIQTSEFYRILKEEKIIPKTSQATYAQFKEVFDKYVEQGKTVLYISGSSVATGTYQSSIMAKNDTEGDIHTFDTMGFSFAAGIYVVTAAQMVKEGKSIEEIMAKLDSMKGNVYGIFSVDTLEYLQKGGRISATKAAIGSILNIKPILEIQEGLVVPVSQVRGKKNVISKMIELVKQNSECNFEDQIVAIGHADDEKEGRKIEEAVKSELGAKETMLFDIGTCIGTHSGPGITAIVCLKK